MAVNKSMTPEYNFLLSSERSGSNLCLRLLDAHPDVCAPPAAQLFPTLTRHVDKYGDLAEKNNWLRMVDDAVNLHQAGFGCWEKYPQADEILEAVNSPTLGAILRHIHSEEAKAQAKPRLFIKAHQAYQYADFLQAEFPNARYIYLVRDPRDMALSWKNTAGLRGGAMRAANIWQKDQQAFLELLNQPALEEKVLMITYEALLAEPEPVLQRICDFLGLSYSDAMLNFHQKTTTRRNAKQIAAWENLGKPLDSSNSGKYRQGLSLEELRYVEAICNREMTALGYTPETNQNDTNIEELASYLQPLEPWEKKDYGQLPLEEREAHTKLREAVNLIEQRAPCLPSAKIDFIENKAIDYALLEKSLENSKRANHWANFGPATSQLSSLIHHICRLDQHRSVVMTKSGTEAIHLAVRLEEYIEERPLKWVVSAFGFISSYIGPLTNAQVVDCDHQGMLSIAALEALDDDSWDGLLITNIFGLCQDVHSLAEFCAQRNKKIILDNAAGLFSDIRLQLPHATEAISFHQTKPWGKAEGGCLILDNKYESLANSLINFGIDPTARSRHLASNGKLSDFNSALINQRLATISNWAPLYSEQANRIEKLAKYVGFNTLLPIAKNAVVAHIPLLHPDRKIPKDRLENNTVALQRYYNPLNASSKNANDIFGRIINFPCHPGLATANDEVIVDLLRRLI